MNSDFNIAVHALVYLDHKACQLSSEELAENICANPSRVRKVLSMLVHAGFVKAREGRRSGGYIMDSRPEDITLRSVSEAVGTCFVSTSWKSGDKEKDCLVASGMAGIMDEIYADLNEVCSRRLQQKTIKDIEDEIFTGK